MEWRLQRVWPRMEMFRIENHLCLFLYHCIVTADLFQMLSSQKQELKSNAVTIPEDRRDILFHIGNYSARIKV